MISDKELQKIKERHMYLSNPDVQIDINLLIDVVIFLNIKIKSLESEVERYRTALQEIIPCIQAMQEMDESESIRYNTGNLAIHKINEALGDSHDHT